MLTASPFQRIATLTHSRTRPSSLHRGFTITELPVAMALLVFVTFIATEGLKTGLEAFRELRGVDKLDQRLSDDASRLQRDLDSTNTATAAFVFDVLRTETPDPDDVQTLRKRYEEIAASADDLHTRLEEVERQTRNLEGQRILRRTRGYLEQIRIAATCTVELLKQIESGSRG